MADLRVSEFIKLRDSGDGFDAFAQNRQTSQVWLWDCGPPPPVAPKRPAAPKGTEGNPDFDLAMIEFNIAKDEYAAELKAHGQRKVEFADFEKRYGGPYLIQRWSVDASEALANDARAVKEGRQPQRRYYLSSRTRGYETLPNGGLPSGLKPGHGHAENIRREREGDVDMELARQRDPVFGTQEIRP